MRTVWREGTERGTAYLSLGRRGDTAPGRNQRRTEVSDPKTLGDDKDIGIEDHKSSRGIRLTGSRGA